MRLKAPTPAPEIHLRDLEGRPITIRGNGRRMLLSFFRDASCPFCNYRVYELTQIYPNLAAGGLDIVAVFASSEAKVKRFVAQRRRPFRIAADPERKAYDTYGIERSLLRKVKGILTRPTTLFKGLRIVGLAGLNTTNMMPADFLINERGEVVNAHYGRDPGDRMALERIAAFVGRGVIKRDRRRPGQPASGRRRAEQQANGRRRA